MALAPAGAQATVNPLLSGFTSDSVTLPGATAVAVASHYAYVTDYYAGKLTAIDISNPSAPVIAGSSQASNALLNASTVNVSGGYAYVVAKNRNGVKGSESNDDGTGNSFTILDIHTNPAEPTIVGSVHDSNTLFGAYGVAISGHYAFVASQGCLSGQPCLDHSVGCAFAVIDISNPAAPTIVAAIHSTPLPPPWGGTGALGHATSVAISGNYAYVTAAYQNRLTVVNIANPLSPKIVATPKDTVALQFPVDVAVSGQYAYVVDQISPGRLTVLDVSNPANPVIVTSLANSALNGAYRIRVRGDFAYVSASSASDVAVVDISNPLIPRIAATITDGTHLSKTTGLDIDPSGSYVVASSPYLTTQTQPTYPPYALQSGGPTLTGTVSAITLDPAPIAVTISPASLPTDPTAQTSANFSFSVNDAVASVRCQLDGTWLPCTTQTSQTYSALAGGAHTFAVLATDAAGLTNTATYNWTVTAPVNTAPPTISGTSAVGQVLSASTGSWTGSPTFAYQWLSCDVNGLSCLPIAGANTSTYTPGVADVGLTLEAQVTATTSAGSTSLASSPTAAVSAPPASTSPPTVSGSATQGQTVSASTGSWSGYPAPTFAYQWERCDQTDANCNAISGASSSTYTLQAADVGSTVLVVVTATNTAGSAQANSTASATITGPPANTSAPTISGTATQGQTLSASTGTWAGYPAPTFAYQWERCDQSGANCNAVSGATSSTYALEAADVGSTLLVTITATNTAGSTQSSSTASAIVTGAPANTSAPAITGTATQGQTLSASTGSWSGYPAPTFAYQWQRCDQGGANCNAISGASSSTYTLQAADVGSTLLVTVTASNTVGSTQASSTAGAIVTGAPANTSAPTITGTATQGQTLSASTGSWSGYPAPTFAYQWQHCNSLGQSCSAIAGATASTYTTLSADVGSTLLVTVTASNTVGSAQSSSIVSAIVTGAPVNNSPPAITGSATEGQMLSASTGSWSGYPTPSFAYQWQRCNSLGQSCSAIAGATASTYTTLSADVSSKLLLTVTASNTVGSGQSSSATTAVVTSAAGPLTPLLDNFARANNTGPPGPNWTHMVVSSTSATNDLFITNQQITGRSGSNGDFWNPQTYGPNSEVWITVAVKPNVDLDPVVLGLRFQSPGAANASGYQAYYIFRSGQADQYRISARVNGITGATLASANGPTLSAGDQLLFRAIGTTLELWRLHTGTWTRILTATDSTFQSAGYLNLTARNGTVRMTNFGGGTLP